MATAGSPGEETIAHTLKLWLQLAALGRRPSHTLSSYGYSWQPWGRDHCTHSQAMATAGSPGEETIAHTLKLWLQLAALGRRPSHTLSSYGYSWQPWGGDHRTHSQAMATAGSPGEETIAHTLKLWLQLAALERRPSHTLSSYGYSWQPWGRDHRTHSQAMATAGSPGEETIAHTPKLWLQLAALERRPSHTLSSYGYSWQPWGGDHRTQSQAMATAGSPGKETIAHTLSSYGYSCT